MIINNNLNAMNAHRNMSFNTAQTGKAMEKLSSGLRINRAGDDAAGLAISEKMRGQIRGLDQATRNAQDGISMIQTAEGALNETHSILQRMRELAVQAGNDTNTTTDRGEIQKEINSLTSEINRVGNTTEFNNQKLLNATSGDIVAGTPAVGGSPATTLTSDAQTMTIAGATGGDVVFNGTYTGTTDATLTVRYNQGDAKFEYSTDGTNFNDVTGTPVNGITIDTSGVTTASATGDGTVTVALTAAVAPTTPAGASSSELKLQIGANESQTMTVSFTDMRAAALGITGTGAGFSSAANVTDGTDNSNVENALDVSNAENAGNAVTVLQDAIEKVSAERSKLGASQNRLEHTINNLSTSGENLQAAESRIRDVDMAKEMMNFTKNNILNQAAQAMLSQANQQPQAVLQLLR
ncbi:flagellin [Exiguobacterium sp. ZOR0005]|uniref:flagellin N-terminal helical domain-containing protein n=1 Tax=Exiguobacterium sp. ZOR0005 TaxID=1339226 RepID=UPI0006476ECB|nr:flagellin [Exiguobacterium sp. ZOR0005]